MRFIDITVRGRAFAVIGAVASVFGVLPVVAAGQAFVPVEQRIARTAIDLGLATGGTHNAAFMDEGGTTVDLATVGPVTIRGVCRKTTNGDNAAPNVAPTAPAGFDGDGDEAKVLIYTADGTLSFQGRHGPRKNVPAGFGTPANTGVAGDAPDASGEGKHQIVAVARDPDPAGTKLEFQDTFGSVASFVATSGGTELLVSVYAGIDVFGLGDKCVFGGLVTVLQA